MSGSEYIEEVFDAGSDVRRKDTTQALAPLRAVNWLLVIGIDRWSDAIYTHNGHHTTARFTGIQKTYELKIDYKSI